MPGTFALLRPSTDAAGAARRLLLGTVLIGLLVLQFLSAHDAAGEHRMLVPAQSGPTSSSAPSVLAPAAGPDFAGAPGPVTSTIAGTTGSERIGILAGCALLLLAGAVIALAAALGRRVRLQRPAAAAVRVHWLRNLPVMSPRSALCVERI